MKSSLCALLFSFALACGSSSEPYEFELGSRAPSDGAQDPDSSAGGVGGAESSGEADGTGGGEGAATGKEDDAQDGCPESRCECRPGFRAEEGNCLDLDECLLGIAACDENASCENAEGSYSCDCPDNQVGDGRFCLMFDPCEETECGDGRCEVIPNGAICDCPLGTTGTACEQSCQDRALSDPVLSSWIESVLGDFAGDWEAAHVGVSTFSARQFAGAGQDVGTVSQLEGLECWTSLERLELSAQEISDFFPLSGFSRLRSLDLSCNPGQDLSPLSNLYQLRELYLDDSECPESAKKQIDLAPLTKLLNLVELVLGGQTIVDWRELSKMKGLTRVHAASVNGQELVGSDLPVSVTSLSLPQSGLGKLPDLSHLRGLVQLNLVGNSIKDAKALLTFDYAVGAEVRLKNNPVSCKELISVEQELAVRHVKIYSDCLPN